MNGFVNALPGWNIIRNHGRKPMHKKMPTVSPNAWMPGWMRAMAVVRCVIPQVRRLVEEAITKFDGIRLHLDCVVIMQNHVHLLIKPNDDENVFKLIGGMRGYSARACNLLRDRTGQAFWIEDSYNRIVRDYEELQAFRDYIRRNPVEAKLRGGEFTLIENHVLE